jgi:hypothetical protein
MLLPDGAFPDVELYRQQADHLVVTGRCQCGCPTVSFTVDSSKAPRARFHGTPLLPVEAEAGDGEDLVQLILFARHGWLESLELVYYSPQPPTKFPAPAELRLVTRSSRRFAAAAVSLSPKRPIFARQPPSNPGRLPGRLCRTCWIDHRRKKKRPTWGRRASGSPVRGRSGEPRGCALRTARRPSLPAKSPRQRPRARHRANRCVHRAHSLATGSNSRARTGFDVP